MSSTVAALREDDLIDALRRVAEPSCTRRVHVGIGDDAAVWQPSRSHRSVITTDALVENVHFTRAMAFRDVGHRAMASNVSDVAAMGARPVLATIALGIPTGLGLDDLRELYRGMTGVASDAHAAIVGGDVTRAPVLTIAITVVGEVRPSNLKLRSRAHARDAIAVTGLLGASRAGLHVLQGAELAEPLRAQALEAHCRPQPRWREGLWLGASGHVHAMMDISDGLSTDLARLCDRSACAAVLDEVPAAPSARSVAQSRGEDPLAYALAGGEDFELLIAVDARAFGYLASRFLKRFGRPLYRIGTLREGSGLVLRNGAHETPISPTGWDHLTQ